jgi:hypothetical protein
LSRSWSFGLELRLRGPEAGKVPELPAESPVEHEPCRFRASAQRAERNRVRIGEDLAHH